MLGQLLEYIVNHSSSYNQAYTKYVLKFDDAYIEEFENEVLTDCHVTARMLINVFAQGDLPISAELYHVEGNNFGYHDFVLFFEPSAELGYLCDSWCDLYPLKVEPVDLKQFWADMRALSKGEKSTFLSKQISSLINPQVTSLSLQLEYSFESVMNYAREGPKRNLWLGNFNDFEMR